LWCYFRYYEQLERTSKRKRDLQCPLFNPSRNRANYCYRTLKLFQRLGVVQKVASPDGQARYELKAEENKGHHHLICLCCGKIIDYDDFAEEELDLVRKTEKALSKKHNFSIVDHHIEFLGLCEQCQKAAG
ncbi:MAG: transcriptional repressor, partial [Spirochaetales bacterium]|nr:transcriptional repressor [Spirochaetales bacterium]